MEPLEPREFAEQLLMWVGALGTAATLAPWVQSAAQIVKYGIAIPDRTKTAASELFYLNRNQMSIVPASANPNVRGRLEQIRAGVKMYKPKDLEKYFSLATIEASNVFKPFAFCGFSHHKADHVKDYEKIQTLVAADLHHSIIALGTPTSNHVVRHNMFYEELPNPFDGHVYNRWHEELMYMPIRFELETDIIIKKGDPAHHYCRAKGPDGEYSDKLIPNWALAGTDGIPRLPITQDGILLEDFLVISVLPNFVNPANVERNVPVVCMGGTHAAGTLAIRELFKSSDCLPNLLNRLNGMGRPKFWQAVFRVELEPGSGKFSSIHSEEVVKVEINNSALAKYAERVSRAL